MHILVTSTSGTGHLHPMVPTLQALSQRGHDITWAAPEAARRSVLGSPDTLRHHFAGRRRTSPQAYRRTFGAESGRSS